ncbi:MAG: Cyanophycin synthase [Candidatus Saccharibacteria bacterium]|nr:Cyanophycin synthase [Candidatus Saccharibacteria bacterium]
MSAYRLKDELVLRGYSVSDVILERTYQRYISPNGKAILFKGAYYDYPFVSALAKKVSKDKTLGYQFAQQFEVPVPVTVQTTDMHVASQFLERYKQVIVKPLDRSGGKGLTLNIRTEDQLREALPLAVHKGQAPLIQRQFIGQEIRLTVIDGQVTSVILRQKPQVVGDGWRTVQELIAAENSSRRSLQFPLLAYPELDISNIPAHFLTDQQILVEGDILELSQTTMIGMGASLYGVTDVVHPSYRDVARRLAGELSPRFLVIDLMAEDYQKAASDDNYIFLEFNTSPALQMYTSLRDGDTPDVIGALADLMDRTANA